MHIKIKEGPGLRSLSLKESEEYYKKIKSVFHELNAKHFNSELPEPEFFINSRLRSALGRFKPPAFLSFRRKSLQTIEIAAYLFENENADVHLQQLLAHEMIHYWLWFTGRPYGHTAEFKKMMNTIGATRYNPIPKQSTRALVYQCPGCLAEVVRKRQITSHACANCCKKYSKGKYDKRFKLILKPSP